MRRHKIKGLLSPEELAKEQQYEEYQQTLDEISDQISISEDRYKVKVNYSESSNSQLGFTSKKMKTNDGTIYYDVTVNSNLANKNKLAIFKHELGHVNQESFEPRFLATMKGIATNYAKKLGDAHPEFNVANNATILQEIVTAHYGLFNLMEDIRMESRESFRRRGRENEFIAQRKDMAGTIPADHINHPTNKLLAVRFFSKEQLTPEEQKEFEELHNMLMLQSHKGLLKLYREFCKKYLHPFLNATLEGAIKEFCEGQQQQEEGMSLGNGVEDLKKQVEKEMKKPFDNNKPVSDSEFESKVKEAKENVKQLKKQLTEQLKKQTQALNKAKSKTTDAIHTAHTISEYVRTSGNAGKRISETGAIELHLNDIENEKESGHPIEAYSEEDLDLTDAKVEQEEERQKLIQKSLLEESNKTEYIDITESHKGSYGVRELPSNVMAEVKRTIDTVTLRKHGLRRKGIKPNLKAYIKNVRTKDTKIFNRKVRRIKLSILVSIDASGSMAGTRMASCKSILHTMMKAIKHNPTIELKAMSWGGGGGNDSLLGYSLIDKLEDMDKLGTANDFGSTPTYKALVKTKQLIRDMKGEKRLVVFLTDGCPSGLVKNGVVKNEEEVIKMCNQEIKQIRNYSKFLPIFIDGEYDGLFKMNKLSIASSEIVPTLKRNFRKTFVSELR